MHYVRFLRQPSITGGGKHQELSLVFVVTSDLGDALLSVREPLTLHVALFKEGDVEARRAGFAQNLSWKPGARVVKEKITVPAAHWRQVLVTAIGVTPAGALPARQFGALATISPKSGVSLRNPLIVPAWFDFKTGSRPAGSTDVCLRKLGLSGPVAVEFEEEFGDSIARHVWDGGLAAVSFLTQLHDGKEEAVQMMPTVNSILRADGGQPLNILELGCGVGVLGIGWAGILSLTTSADILQRYHILMTDVPDAEERALANIRLFQDSQEKANRPIPQMQYENLDWGDGRQGKFSPSVMSKAWNLVILSDCTYNTDTIPALVETLSQLHSVAKTSGSQDGTGSLKVFLATKPRHSSEQVVFDALSSHGWNVAEKAVVELHGLPEESDDVEFYLFSKNDN